ncbi:hypothetical protein SAICODRAFT_4741 [Saitoella complicata NRRL Y-17804]|uniref:Programmed cell death protein 2 C-terminal domain-containing protein n=1 Tax=Saitoella complicata (strain BCRC 22490 / CBS 7301 / JCM 7358 / NBRC 10748 / NRRL Y-17804) TaxID=698492 RepID=A0A0E9N9A3_SAICN|nr:uncharacterized protein SAICODRAFT_4741 [Saitoella complicata NRRL Y-17804]ODQ56562.1 hypothetical protein SAICODRAFT_4741 [Saitoella complicata NRRL Y-17804]GAO46462.1 hypothetical protein G7K_0693-t1 [Saitoella complicata NRRL Y-17804]
MASKIKTSVLLGYPDGPASAETGLDQYCTFIGGEPLWLTPNTPVDARYAQCGVCNSYMNLLLQAYAPIEGSNDERVIYVWGCAQKACQKRPGSVKAARAVLRGERLPEIENLQIEEEEPEVPISPASALTPVANPFAMTAPAANPFAVANPFSAPSASASPFGGASNPFAAPASAPNPFASPAGANPFAAAPAPSKPKKAPQPKVTPPTTTSKPAVSASTRSFAAIAKQNIPPPPPPKPRDPPLPWPETVPSYPCQYLFITPETLKSAPQKAKAPKDRIEELAKEAVADMKNGAEEWGGEKYESSALDKVFKTFTERVAENPEQCVRYERSGAPLFFSSKDAVGKQLLTEDRAYNPSAIPACPHCRSPRVFELQVMPHAVAILEEDVILNAGLEWCVILVATCLGDCSPSGMEDGGVGYTEEWVAVQWE